jgi:hypothetical protein
MGTKRSSRFEEELNRRVELDEAATESVAREREQRALLDRIARARDREQSDRSGSLDRQRLQWAGEDEITPIALKRLELAVGAFSALWAASSVWVAFTGPRGILFGVVSFLGFLIRPHFLGLVQAALLLCAWKIARDRTRRDGIEHGAWVSQLPSAEKDEWLDEAYAIRVRLQFLYWAFFVLAFTFMTGALGWEPAICYHAGTWGSVVFSLGGGTLARAFVRFVYR